MQENLRIPDTIVLYYDEGVLHWQRPVSLNPLPATKGGSVTTVHEYGYEIFVSGMTSHVILGRMEVCTQILG